MDIDHTNSLDISDIVYVVPYMIT